MNEQQIKNWIDRDPDPETREEIEGLLDAGDHDALVERFLGRLEFGTAGLRGVLGGGPNRMNRLVVIETSLGFAHHVLATVDRAAARGIVVAYDGRKNSEVFARDAAAAFARLGARVHLFPKPMPTPVAAFAVRHLEAAAGVVITASHNPPEYNGYKAYWSNGAQIIPPVDRAVTEAILRAANSPLPELDFEAAVREGLVCWTSETVVEAYLDGVAAQLIHADKGDRSLPITYTPLHGVGAELAETAMKRAGFLNIEVVASQREPDGAFPTVAFPNPEEPGAMDEVLACARESGAELVFANDPDADRLAVAVRDGESFRTLSGDEVGILLASDLLSDPPENSVVATTLVSSTLLERMALAKGVEFFETPTGFKWIADGAISRENAGQRFLFGYEEALGYTIGDHVRDKDGILAMVAFAEMVAVQRAQGRTVFDQLNEVYREHGLVLTQQRSVRLNSGFSVGRVLRAQLPDRVAGRAVQEVDDLESGRRMLRNGQVVPLDFPRSDVLIYRLDGGARVVVRPSGTEPKLKCYYLVHRTAAEEPHVAELEARADLNALIQSHQEELAALL